MTYASKYNMLSFGQYSCYSYGNSSDSFIHTYCLNALDGPQQLVVAFVLLLSCVDLLKEIFVLCLVTSVYSINLCCDLLSEIQCHLLDKSTIRDKQLHIQYYNQLNTLSQLHIQYYNQLNTLSNTTK